MSGMATEAPHPAKRHGDEGSPTPLLRALTLQPVEPKVFDEAYVGTTQYCPWPKAYGGDVVAQALVAAMRSCPDKALHSTHAYFMRPVDIGAQVTYEVERLRDGRGYATRQVRAFQNGKPAYVALVSFHAGGEGPDAGSSAGEYPAFRTAPESVPTSAAVLDLTSAGVPGSAAGQAADRGGPVTAEARHYWQYLRSFDMRHVPGPVYVDVEGERVPHQAVWVKAFGALPGVEGLNDEDLHRAALAYVCDYTIIEPSLRRLGLTWADADLMTASLDHSMWFHRPAPVDDWLLYAQESVSVQSSRALGFGRFFTRDGVHVASLAQEAMVRAGA